MLSLGVWRIGLGCSGKIILRRRRRRLRSFLCRHLFDMFVKPCFFTNGLHMEDGEFNRIVEDQVVGMRPFLILCYTHGDLHLAK